MRLAQETGLLTWLMLRLARRRSLLVRALLEPKTTFLDGMTTYVMKLGADNLPPPFNSDIDKRLAAAPHVVSMRLRLQQCAEMLAAGFREELHVSCAAPLQLITIGGGTAIDMLNSLTL